jgi:hypothetical protein
MGERTADISFCHASIASGRRLIALVWFGTYPRLAMFLS